VRLIPPAQLLHQIFKMPGQFSCVRTAILLEAFADGLANGAEGAMIHLFARFVEFGHRVFQFV